MSLDQLKAILEKDPIISTFSPRDFDLRPEDVEQHYRTYARTHVPLGETDKYVDTIVKWTGGANKGAFVGAVIGDYGQGKTSFLVHAWESCRKQGIFAVPPFTLQAAGGHDTPAAIMQNLLDGVAAWVKYALRPTHPALAARAAARYQEYRTKTIEDIAARRARDMNRPTDEILEMLRGVTVIGDITVDGLLDYVRDIGEVVKEAGFKGLLLLLDEPEVAAGNMGYEAISALLFDVIDKLGNMDGDFGVFMSIAQRFYAAFSARHASATARLAARGCRIDLSRLYGPDFARALWLRYCSEFALPRAGADIIHPAGLEAIGQLGSSMRSDLGYGPRTVVSAFNRMVYRHLTEQGAYEPGELAADCLAGEIMVEQAYGARVQEIFGLPEVAALPEEFRLTLAAFPNGVPLDTLETLGFTAEEAQRHAHATRTAIYRMGRIIGFNMLRQGGPVDQDELGDRIRDADATFAPSPATFERARSVVVSRLISRLFPARQGEALTGWQYRANWARWNKTTTHLAVLNGAFPQTAARFPSRSVAVAVGDTDVDTPAIIRTLGRDDRVDLVFHVRLNWHATETAEAERLVIRLGDPLTSEAASITLTVDINRDAGPDEALSRWVDETRQTPLFLLVLLAEIDKLQLDKDIEALWTPLRDRIERNLLLHLFAKPDLARLASDLLGTAVGGGADAVPQMARVMLERRYPDYVTLIRQPRWKEPVENYLNVLSNSQIPLAARRGSEAWNPTDDLASRVLGGNRMNLPARYASYDALITVNSAGRGRPLEVQFRLHPLERQIRDRVTESGQKRTIDGRDCWWIPFDDEQQDVIFRSGYQLEELELILRIGKERGSFAMSLQGGRRGLYCVPLDIPEMRRKLEENLAAIQELAGRIEDLGLAPPRVELGALSTQIESVQDEDAFHRLVHAMDDEKRLLLAGLGSRFQELNASVEQLSAEVHRLRNDVRAAAVGPGLRQAPSGQSSWVTALSQVGNFLAATLNDVDRKAGELVEAIGQARLFRDDVDARTDDRLHRLMNLAGRVEESRTTLAEHQRQLGGTQRYAQQYVQWLDLLRFSDNIHRELLELERDSGHQVTATALRTRLDGVWAEITADLNGRLVLALDAAAQYRARLTVIDDDRQRYLQDLTQTFNRIKERANLLLHRLDIGDAQLRQVFNRDQSEMSYRLLYEEGAQLVRATGTRECDGLERARLELLYQRDILGVELASEPPDPIVHVDDALRDLRAAVEVTTPDRFRTVVESYQPTENRDAPLPEPWDALADALASARVAQRAVRLAPTPPSGVLGPEAVDLLEMVPDAGMTDLKSLILDVLRDGRESGTVLDASLQALVELFRAGKVEIRVQRARSR